MRVWPVVVAFLSFPLLTARVEARSESMQLNSTRLRMCVNLTVTRHHDYTCR